jgi:hypothetical protein
MKPFIVRFMHSLEYVQDVAFAVGEVPLLEDVFENDGDTVHLIGTPPLAVPEHPEAEQPEIF